MEINKLVYDRRSLTIIHNIVITLMNNSDDDSGTTIKWNELYYFLI